jgi:hypothetical protein
MHEITSEEQACSLKGRTSQDHLLLIKGITDLGVYYRSIIE